MAVITALVSSITTYLTLDNEDDTPTGATAVRSAVKEVENLQGNLHGTLGEPDIIKDANQFVPDPKVVVPVYDLPYSGPQKLVFDLPEGRNDVQSNFLELLEIFELDFDAMEQLEGEEVPVTIYGGNLTVDWLEVTKTETTDEEDETEVSEDEPSESPVNVEKTTISPDDTEKGGEGGGRDA
jgi:hypothetical protein